MAFDYEAAKAQYGAQRAREMEKEASAAPAPTPATPAPPTNFPAPPTGGSGSYRPPTTGAPTPASAGLGDLSGFKTYADWQAANRAQGGQGNNAQVEAYLGGLSGKPAATPAAPTAVSTTAPADTSKWRTDVPMSEGDHPDAVAGPSGDSFVDTIRSTATGSEDYKRFSNAQLLAWKDKYIPGSSPPKFYNDFGDVVDKPTESGPKSEAAGYATGEKDAGKAAASGGGGGGGGAAGGGTAAGTGGDLSSLMESKLKEMLSGDNSRYSPKAVQGLLASIKQNVESQRQAQIRQSGQEAVGRGMSRSGQTGVDAAKINSAAGASFTSQYSGVLKDKINADQQDKLDALDRSQKYLDSMRDELYRRDMSAIQRQQFKANLDLAYANIAAQRDALASQQQYGKDMLAANYGYSGTFGG